MQKLSESCFFGTVYHPVIRFIRVTGKVLPILASPNKPNQITKVKIEDFVA
jgi:hypothetical protein